MSLGLRATARRDEAAQLGPSHSQYADAFETYNSARTAYYSSYALPAAFGAITLTIALIGIATSDDNGDGQVQAGLLLPKGGGGLCAYGTF